MPRGILRPNPSAALVPPELAELVEPIELVRREDRSVHAYQAVVERARITDADPALHVPLEARLNRDLARLRKIDHRLHHPFRAARQDLVELLAIHELLREGRHESGEAARPIVRGDVDSPLAVARPTNSRSAAVFAPAPVTTWAPCCANASIAAIIEAIPLPPPTARIFSPSRRNAFPYGPRMPIRSPALNAAKAWVASP